MNCNKEHLKTVGRNKTIQYIVFSLWIVYMAVGVFMICTNMKDSGSIVLIVGLLYFSEYLQDIALDIAESQVD